MADVRVERVISNGTITAAATKDSDLVACLGAKVVYFTFTSAQATEAFAGSAAFQVLVQVRPGEDTLAPASEAVHGLTVVGASNLNSADSEDGVVVQVKGVGDLPIGVYKVGCRVKAGGSNMTDVDCDASVVF